MNKSSEIHVSFVGGLGNQLFQYANALMLNPQGRIIATSILHEPSEKFLAPEIAAYASLDVDTQRFLTNRLSLRLHNLILRNSSFENRHPGRNLSGNLLQGFAVHSLRFMLNESPPIHHQSNLGFQNKQMKLSAKKSMQIGYFQHCHWLDNSKVTNQLRLLYLQNPSERFKEISRSFLGKRILVIHMRFGDYLEERLFGVPTVDYFRKSIAIQMNETEFDEIVVFTNGERNALKILSELRIENVLIISNHEQISASETLELMRLGSAYVISNSTFGWWGAFLSNHTNARVTCPIPWFRGMNEPNELIPSHWLRVPD
jgi:hypothetical protein